MIKTNARNTHKRILLVTHFFPPNHNSGTEIYTLGLGKALQANGHEVHVVCAEDWESGPKYWNGVTTDKFEDLIVHRHQFDWRKASNPNKILYDSPQIETWFDQFLVSNPFDIAHVTHVSSLGIGVLHSIKRAQIPLVISLVDFWFLCPTLQLVKNDGSLCDGITTAWQCQTCLTAKWDTFQKLNSIPIPEPVRAKIWNTLSHIPIVSRQPGLRGRLLDINHRKKKLTEALSVADICLTASQFVKDIFRSNGFEDTLIVHPYGHDLTWLDKYQGKLPSTKLRIGFIGQIIPAKGIHILIKAAQLLFISGETRVDFSIYGDLQKDPIYSANLRLMAEGMKNIEFCGSYKHEESAAIFSRFDVLVVPSLWYDFPLVIYEAFATQTPVIATNLGGMSEAVQHEVNGFLFNRGDAEDLARQIRKFIDDRELVNCFKQHIEPVRKIEDEVLDLETLYDSLTEKYQREKPV